VFECDLLVLNTAFAFCRLETFKVMCNTAGSAWSSEFSGRAVPVDTFTSARTTRQAKWLIFHV